MLLGTKMLGLLRSRWITSLNRELVFECEERGKHNRYIPGGDVECKKAHAFAISLAIFKHSGQSISALSSSLHMVGGGGKKNLLEFKCNKNNLTF